LQREQRARSSSTPKHPTLKCPIQQTPNCRPQHIPENNPPSGSPETATICSPVINPQTPQDPILLHSGKRTTQVSPGSSLFNNFNYSQHPFKRNSDDMKLPSPESYPNSILSNESHRETESQSQYTDIHTESYPIKFRTSPLPTLIRETLLFDSIEIPALIDSGASMSIISPATLKKIPKSHIHKISNCTPIRVSLAAQGASPIEIKEQVEICFELKSTNSYYLWRFFILPS
jgi:hypothetical protein